MAKKTAKPKVTAEASDVKEVALTDRREKTDRRTRTDRRKRNVPVAVDRRVGERRTGERRRQIDPTTCERDYDTEEIEFMKAIEDYKRDFCRPFPTWSEVLEVAKALGYRKVAEPTKINANRAKSNYDDE
jgi:hypothetical protein